MTITVVILTYNEALHLQRCIESLSALYARIIVMDSYSTDKTLEIASESSAEVFQNTFVNQAQQFQWAMDHCDIDTEWVLRIDADETIDNELAKNILDFIAAGGRDCNGAVFHRKHIFMGHWVRFGGRFPLPMLRLFRIGTAHIEQRWMDEHIVLDAGKSCVLAGGFEDNNLNSVSWFIDKHNKYATREMVDIMLKKINSSSKDKVSRETGLGIWLKRFVKQSIYMKLPYFVRPFLYFCFRYLFQLGFLDGARGFAYHFLQGFWYRVLVDVKCLEADIALRRAVSAEERIQVLEGLSGYDLSAFKEG